MLMVPSLSKGKMKPLCVCLLAATLIAGCQSATNEQWLAKFQPMAIQTAETVARADFNCPSAKGTVTQSMDNPPGSRRAEWGPDQTAYRVDAVGCGQRQYYDVICSDSRAGCYVVGRAPVGK
jgi:hypothetical protein